MDRRATVVNNSFDAQTRDCDGGDRWVVVGLSQAGSEVVDVEEKKGSSMNGNDLTFGGWRLRDREYGKQAGQ